MNEPFKIGVTTSFNSETGIINQHLSRLAEPYSRLLIDTRDKGIREALIKMGWTPPPDKVPQKPPSIDYPKYKCEFCDHISPRCYSVCPICHASGAMVKV